MKFRYQKFGTILRPVIEIRVKNGDKSLRYAVLVDSGADMCLFDAEVGEAIGLNVTKGRPEQVVGVGGKASVYYAHPVTIEVGGWPVEIEAGFMQKVGNAIMPYGIVGQKGFFEHFVVKFDLNKEEVELKQKSN